MLRDSNSVRAPFGLVKGGRSKTGRSRRHANEAKQRIEWILREAHCIAKPGMERETLERLVQVEVDRMRGRGVGEEAIAQFQAAAAVQIALYDGTRLPVR